MTPNEKAATFIGWKPNQQLFCHICAQKASQKNKWSAETCAHAESKVQAPDMTKPENYMRAFEFLCAKYSVRADRKFDMLSLGEAMILTLAGLYDAEHPDKAGKIK